MARAQLGTSKVPEKQGETLARSVQKRKTDERERFEQMNLRTLSWHWMMVAGLVPFLGGVQECTPEDPQACPAIYAPVCGTDGNTYGNECEANRAGVMVQHEGECRIDPVTCWDDGECPDGQQCNHDYCYSPCMGDEDISCPAVCYGICEDAPPPVYCSSDEECGAAEHCTIDPSTCPVCEDGMACPAIACVGTCEPDEPGCLSDADCATGEICAYDGGPMCPPGEMCEVYAPERGVCIPQHDPRCTSDSDCGPGERCAIDAGEPCPDGEMCPMWMPVDSGVCVPDYAPRCLSDDECGAGEYCSHEYCEGPPPCDEGVDLTVCYGSCQPRMCPDLYCPHFQMCEFGQRVDETGCPTCECAEPPPPPPVCDGVICDLYCEFGFQTDETGCPICACAEPPPMGCDPVVCTLACEEWERDDAGCPVCACADPAR
jgi:hypothetical protein